MDNKIYLDNRRQLILNSLDTFYVVKKGKVFLYFTEFDQNDNNKRKHYINTLDENEIFVADFKRTDEEKMGFIALGEQETEVLEYKISECDVSRVNDFYKKIYDSVKLNGDSNELVEITKENLTDIHHNNMCILKGASNQIEKKITIEKESNKRRRETDKILNSRTAHGILSLFTLRKENKNVFNDIRGKDVLYDTCKIICDKMSIKIAPYEDVKKCITKSMDVEDIGRVSKFPVRTVILEENWYKTDNGALLVNAIEDERPLALIPVSPKKYMVYDVINQQVFPLTSEFAKEIIPRGQMLYRPFENKELKLKDVFLFGIKEAWKRDIVRILALTLIGTLMGLILPILNQRIFDDYIPEGDSSQLLQVGILIICFMVGNFFVSLLKMFSTFRASNRMEYGIQAAVFDRLLNFPNKIYSMYNSGELATRAMGITMIFNTMADVVVSVVLSSIFSVLYLWRMVGYSKNLSLVGVLMVAITIVITITMGFVQLKYEKKLIEISNKMAGFMYQLLLGINKIRLSSGEDRAIYRWNKDYLKSREIVITKEKITQKVMAINNIINVLFSVVIYYMIIEKGIKISFGEFAGFMAAFGSFSGAMVEMAQTFISVNRLIPIYEKAKPILETLPEHQESAVVPGEISGDVEVSNVSFRYSEDGDNVLKNLNFKIKPGEYIGIVGPSGGGKSTLLKVLLGFETPQVGKIFYDDKDLESIDKRELRKKLGVVLQDGQTIAGSIYENITINNSKISMKRVREVIEEVGFKDDIEKMPMGIHTMLMEDGGTISGGQKQRILIARAVANKPKILFFDEATSALDNITQAVVCESLEKLKATRVVVAHRLSTIIDCDRILVIDGGKIKEQGSYKELMDKKGLFFQMAKRQIA